jgi:hypothetical protein
MWHVIDLPSQLILFWVIISLITEIIALLFAIILRNNFLVYNIFSLVSLLLLGVYFKKVIKRFRNYYFMLGYTSIITILWMYSVYYQNSLFTLNSPLMLIEGAVIIAFSILSIDNIVSVQSKRYFKLTTSIHFWFAVVFLFYWCITILQWGLYKYFVAQAPWSQYLNLALSFAGTLVNLSIAILFYISPKLKQADAS